MFLKLQLLESLIFHWVFAVLENYEYILQNLLKNVEVAAVAVN